MPLESKLRFATKYLVAAISLVGLTAAYLFVTKTSDDPSESANVVAIDHTPTASINHFPEESLAVEALAGVNAKPNHASGVGSRAVNKKLDPKIGLANKPTKIVKNTQAKASELSQTKISGGMIVKAKKPIHQKKTPAESAKKSLLNIDPIAGLLAKH